MATQNNPEVQRSDTNPHRHPLAMTEILSLVFQHCRDHDIAMSAVVCKDWELPALKVLWHTVVDGRNLFGLLGVVGLKGETLAYTELIDPQKWPRFERYATLIRRFIPKRIEVPHLSANLFQEAYLFGGARPSSLIPNLTELRHVIQGVSDIQTLAYVLQSRIVEIELETRRLSEGHVAVILRLLAAHAPRLSSLQWHTAEIDQFTLMSDSVATAIRSLTSLERWCCSMQLLALLPVWEALGSLPALKVIGCFADDHCYLTPSDAHNPLFREGTFTQLRILLLCMTGKQATNLLRSGVPSTLMKISLHVFTNNTKETHTVLELITQELSQIPIVEIDFCTATSRVDLRSFIYNIKCPLTISFLTITVNVPLGLTDEDIKTLASTLPGMVELELGPNPISPSPTKVTLKSLEFLAASCPNLTTLGMYINTDQSDPMAVRGTMASYTPFAALQILNLGSSALRPEDLHPVAKWLSALCPNKATSIRSEMSPRRARNDSAETRARFAEAVERWNTLTPLIQEWREHNMTITRPWVEEVDRLRDRLRSLGV